MNNIKIGIPRALLYYKYQYLWEKFFEELDIDTTISPITNKSIIENGSNIIVDESCLALKIFIGHVNELNNKCDYILIPRLESLKKKEKVCTNFMALYDLCHSLFSNKILEFNIDIEKGIKEIDAFIEIGRALNINKIKVIKAYYKAQRYYKEKIESKMLKQDLMLMDRRKKILLASHPYNLYDDFIGKPIVKYLEEANIIPIFSDLYESNSDEYQAISKDNYWTYSKEILNSIIHYKDIVDGIIIISSFPCGPDSLTNEMIIKKINNIPIITLIIDELNNNSGVITRLESFIDIIKLKRGESIA